jgi:transposase InsO family protein
VSAHQEIYPIGTMCRVLGVSPSGYYAWRHRVPSARAQSDAALTPLIRAAHTRSRESYGVPRMTVELNEAGHHVNHKRVERLMRTAGLAGISRRKGTRTTRPDRGAQAAPDLVQRDFRSSRSGRIVGGRRDVHAHLGRLSLSCRRPRCLESPHRGVGDGRSSAHRTGRGGARYGPVATPS